jgi:hypothetical protein
MTEIDNYWTGILPFDKNFNKFILKLGRFDIDSGPWIAGGSVRKLWQGKDWDDGDIDVWFRYKEQYLDFCKRMMKKGKCVSVTDNAITFKIRFKFKYITVQAISTFSDNIHDLLNKFDFTICQFATANGNIYATQNAIDDCQKNKITLNPTRYSSQIDLKRLVKYCEYGFNPDHELVTEGFKFIQTHNSNNFLSGFAAKSQLYR